MSYQVLARKWRPRVFEQMAGQEHVVRALCNAIELGRLHHAYLFTGTRGVGKTTLARILAKCFNCEQGVTAQPCGDCSACRQIDAGNFMDLLEVDAASRTGVDDMRELLDNTQYAPTAGRFRIYLIDEVHMLSINSFNALLKTLEEPPEHVKFFFATTHPQKIPVTILSRCLQFNLTRLPHQIICEYLSGMLTNEGVDFEENALNEISVAAEGSVRDALSLLDQAIAYGNGSLKSDELEAMLGIASRQHVAELLRCVASGDTVKLFETVALLHRKAADFTGILNDVIVLLHQVALYQALPGAETSPQFRREDVRELAAAMQPEDVQLCYQVALAGKRDLPHLPDDRMAFEMLVLRMIAFTPLRDGHVAAPPPPTVAPPRDRHVAEPTPSTAAPLRDGHVAVPPPPTVAPPQDGRAAPVPEMPPARDLEKKHPPPAAPGDEADGRLPFRLGDYCNSTDQWIKLIEAMHLEGALREICYNALLTAASETEAKLLIDADTVALCTEQRKQEISDALDQLAGRKIKLAFETVESDETPSREKMRTALKRQRDAEHSIENDPNVSLLKQHFDAEIVPDSTKPLKPGS